MGAARVWVELGPGPLVRADRIVTVTPLDPQAVTVQVTGERQLRELDLACDDSYPESWQNADIERFRAQLKPRTIVWGLAAAIERAAAAQDTATAVRLRVSAACTEVGWKVHQISEHDLSLYDSDFWSFSFASARELRDPAKLFPRRPAPASWARPRPSGRPQDQGSDATG